MMFVARKTLLFIITFLPASFICQSQVNVRDSFEWPELSKIWSTERMVPGSIRMQSAIVRNGHSAAAITLKSGDIFEKGQGKSRDSERDELLEASNLFSAENKKYEFRFSMFLPDSFPVVPTRLVIAQWKQLCPAGGICGDDSPVMAIRYVSGRLYITIQTDSVTKTVYQTREEIRNRWLDFTFKTRFSRSDSGEVEAWLNEKPIVHFKGANCYSAKRGYPEKSYFYFKMGLYRDLMTIPMTIYIDDYSKTQLAE
ncbi:MAG: polysaccharide lyase [Bacteroidota bacterium]|nr:polysaccharide lyase [Bacteroidota bacterium]